MQKIKKSLFPSLGLLDAQGTSFIKFLDIRKISLIISLLSILTLISLSIFQSPIQISSPEQFPSLVQNQPIMTKGKVIEETLSDNYKTLTLENKIKIQVDLSTPSFKNKEIQVIGKIDNFISKKLIAYKIIINN